jgi:hypothetical protein
MCAVFEKTQEVESVKGLSTGALREGRFFGYVWQDVRSFEARSFLLNLITVAVYIKAG